MGNATLSTQRNSLTFIQIFTWYAYTFFSSFISLCRLPIIVSFGVPSQTQCYIRPRTFHLRNCNWTSNSVELRSMTALSEARHCFLRALSRFYPMIILFNNLSYFICKLKALTFSHVSRDLPLNGKSNEARWLSGRAVVSWEVRGSKPSRCAIALW